MNRRTLLWGLFFITWGFVALFANIFNFDVWKIFWPGAIILLGIWFMVRPRFDDRKGGMRILPIADFKRTGDWKVVDDEIYTFVGDVKLDFTNAEVPVGETHLAVRGFVSEIDVIIPAGIGFSVSSSAVVNQIDLMGDKEERIFMPLNYSSEGYEAAERKIRLEITSFVVELDVREA